MTSNTANVSMDGAGHLAITPLRDAAGNWTSGRIETQRTDFRRRPAASCAIEASLQQPNVTGAAAAGYWPAFWSLGAPARPVGATNWPSIGEIDIMEDINGLSSVFGTLHCGPSIPGTCNETTGLGSGEVACPGCQTGFHTYGVEWDRSVTPETLRWYRDGAIYFSLNRNQVDATTWNNATHHGFFVILNVAIGGGFPAAFGGGPTASTRSGVPMLVDYVAVYSAGGGTTPPPTHPPPTTPPPTGGTGAYGTIQAESFNAQSGTQLEATTDAGGGQDIGFIANGDWASYPNVDFGSSRGAPVQRPGRLRCRGGGERAGRGAAGQPVQRADRQLRDRQHRRLAELADGPGEHQRGDRRAHGLPDLHQRPAGRLRQRQLVHLRALDARGTRLGPGREDGSGPRPGPVCHDWAR